MGVGPTARVSVTGRSANNFFYLQMLQYKSKHALEKIGRGSTAGLLWTSSPELETPDDCLRWHETNNGRVESSDPGNN